MIYVPLPFACMPKLSTYSILDKSEKNGKLYLNFSLLSLHECCTKCLKYKLIVFGIPVLQW